MAHELDPKYGEITRLFELADDLLSTVDSEFVSDPESQLLLVGDLVEQVGEAADVLSEEFITVIEMKNKRNPSSKTRIEASLRKIFMALDAYNRRVLQVTGAAAKALRNIADPIVDKIRKQVERVIVIFLDYVQLSLDRIMHKNEIEEMKQREEKIALMLYQMGY